MISMKLKQLATATTLILTSTMGSAAESMWLYAEGSDTLPKGKTELELSDISRISKDSGHYQFNDIRAEVEYGLTDKLTLSGEVLIYDHDYSVKDPELNPMYETQGEEGGSFNDTQYAGYELSMKYNLMSPYKDIFGLSVGLSYEKLDKYRLDGADIDQDSFVTTLYFQKNFMDDTLILAVTPKVEFERRKTPGVLEEEIALDFSAGLAYRFMPKWYAGLEFRHQSDYLSVQENGEFEEGVKPSSFDLGDFQIGDQYQHGNYFGPTVHYAEKEFWVTGGILFQVSGAGGVSSGGKNYDEHEKVHVGLAVGYEFD